MAHLTGEELNQRQLDILWDSLSDNSLLGYSPIAALNKQLTTTNKSVIKAINELVTRLVQAESTVSTFSTEFASIIGNAKTEPELVTNLKKIDENVLKSIYKLYLEIGDAEDISHLGDNVKAAILEVDSAVKSLTTRVDTIEDILDDIETKDKIILNPSNPNEIILANLPNHREITVFVNGIEYLEGEAFVADRANKKVTWTFTYDNDGFDLDSEFNIRVHYFYEP